MSQVNRKENTGLSPARENEIFFEIICVQRRVDHRRYEETENIIPRQYPAIHLYIQQILEEMSKDRGHESNAYHAGS
jgi:hypothetical protein